MSYQSGPFQGPPPVTPFPQPLSPLPPQVPWYHQKWFIVLVMLLFPPVGLVLLGSSPATQLSGRIVWTAFASLVFVVMLSGGSGTQSKTDQAPKPAAATSPSSSGTGAQGTSPSAQPAQVQTSAPSPTPAPAPAKAAPSWQVVKKWTGNGIKQTETFQVTSREWRITWKTQNENVAGLIQIFVHDENGNMVTLVANQQGVGGDTSYVRGKAGGRYYLNVNSANLDWEVVVEDQR